MKKFYYALSVVGLLSVSQAQAAGYADAGCGLGSMIFSKNTIVSQTTAWTTNMVWANQTFGITTGTSNCTANGWVKEDRKEKYFAEANFGSLSVEMARGQGDSLQAFAQVLGCSDDSVSEFGRMTREKYNQIFTSEKTTSMEMLDQVKEQISLHPQLAQACGMNV